MIPAGAERRLRGHVDRILRNAHVPTAEREEVAEELFGHLAERWEALIGDGLSEPAALERAIRDFGTADRVGRDLTRAFRGRFFASTIGVLLPAAQANSRTPTASSFLLSVLMFVSAGIMFGGALDSLHGLSPIRGLLQATAWAIGACLLLLTAMALLRGQRWALYVSLAMSAVSAADGAISYFHDPATIPLTGLGSGAVLATAVLDRRRLWRATGAGGPTRPLAAALVITSLVLSYSSGPLLAAFDDPTQAAERDLGFEVRVRCDTDFEPMVEAEVLRWRVDVFWTWSRTSVLPGGLRGWERYTDMIVLRHPGEEWWLADTQRPEEALSRRSVGWPGGGEPAEALIPHDLPRSIIDFGVLTRETHSAVRYQAAWVMKSQRDTIAWPDEAEAWYFHGDRWALVARAGCDESADGVPANVADD